MAFLSQIALQKIGFRHLGQNVKVSDKASIYRADLISIGDNSRIDDFCVLSGDVQIGNYVHLAIRSSALGTEKASVIMEDFTTLAYNVSVFTLSDDYSGEMMTNCTISNELRNCDGKEVVIKKHSIIGAHSVIFPGVVIETGTAIGAMSLVKKSTQPWTIYFGIPARPMKARKKDLIKLEEQFVNQNTLLAI